MHTVIKTRANLNDYYLLTDMLIVKLISEMTSISTGVDIIGPRCVMCYVKDEKNIFLFV